MWMRSSRVIRASNCQCQSHNSPGFNPSILRHSGIEGRQMKQCWAKSTKKFNKSPVKLCNSGAYENYVSDYPWFSSLKFFATLRRENKVSSSSTAWEYMLKEAQVIVIILRLPTGSQFYLWFKFSPNRHAELCCRSRSVSESNGIPGSLSVSRRAKMTHKHIKKAKNFIFWSTRCSMLGLKASPVAWTSSMEA